MARPYIIVIASEKGGVGKTTLATNLAIYLQGLVEDLPITLLSFDNHFTIDRMFRITKPDSAHHVGKIFSVEDPGTLSSLGQYGINYIPSCENLQDPEYAVHSVDQLAQAMSRSSLSGLVIIDTSPTLDIFTRNALYAADRIIVPIKDAPSLENCRHLAEFLIAHNRPKALLKILPCLIDTRIRFDGPFRNSYQLLKAYAINRGYRCFEGYVAKSPKVESLATNPSGKIFPVMTHARATEVHLQLTHLARQVYLDYLEQGPLRLNEVSNNLFEQAQMQQEALQYRLKNLHPSCPCCDTPLPSEQIWPHAWYFQNNTGTASGYIEDDCFIRLLIQDCYPELSSRDQQPLLKELLVGADETASLLLRLQRQPENARRVSIYRLDHRGKILSERTITLKDPGFFQRRGKPGLSHLFSLGEQNELESPAEELILARRCGAEPQKCLEQPAYHDLLTMFATAQTNLARRFEEQ